MDIEKAPPIAPVQSNSEDEFPTFKKLLVILVAIYLCMFIVALVSIPRIPRGARVTLTRDQDRTILGTAIPKITDDFHAITDVGWYGSAYLLTSCAFQLIYGRIYTFYSAKNVLLGAIIIFEVGVRVSRSQNYLPYANRVQVCGVWCGSQFQSFHCWKSCW
jgi:MFS family permease